MPTTIQQTQAPAPPTPAPTVVVAQPSIEALQAQAVDLTVQLAGLRTEQAVLRRTINDRNWDPSARPEQTARYAEVNAKIARAQADLENVREQIAARQGVDVTRIGQTGQLVPPPVGRFTRSPDPDMVVGVSFVLALSFVLPISIAIAKRIWRGSPHPQAAKTDEIAPRLDRLEHAMDAVAIEIERISEGQRFVTKIFTERPAANDLAQRVDDGKAPLALGAGPIEPIRVAERQGVKQAITPY
jgi:hypothetical protein